MVIFHPLLVFQRSGEVPEECVSVWVYCVGETDGGNLKEAWHDNADLCTGKFMALTASSPEARRFNLCLQWMPTELQGGSFRQTNAAAH